MVIYQGNTADQWFVSDGFGSFWWLQLGTNLNGILTSEITVIVTQKEHVTRQQLQGVKSCGLQKALGSPFSNN